MNVALDMGEMMSHLRRARQLSKRYCRELRNETPHRMERKASKRDIVWSKSNLLKDAENHRLNSNDGELWFENHIKIDNTNLHPDEVADMVIEQFKLVANEKEEKEYRFGV